MQTKEVRMEYCQRCWILFEMARNPDGNWSIVLPPHDAQCEKVAALKPKPLRA